MDVDVTDNSRKRKNGTECILCMECGKCFAFKDGDIHKAANELRRNLGNYTLCVLGQSTNQACLRMKIMNEVNKTLYIPLYGKAQISKKGIILKDPTAEEIWEREGFAVKGKSKSKWLCYNMAMRARVFDEWTRRMINLHTDATVIHIGCGLDSRYLRVNIQNTNWVDCDFPDVIAARKKYYTETDYYSMKSLDASNQKDLYDLPDAARVIVVLEGISMYLTNNQLAQLFHILDEKYQEVHVLMDVYTVFGAKASKYKNPVNDVGVSELYGVDSVASLLEGTKISLEAEHSFTPDYLVDELHGLEKCFFKLMFTGKMYRNIYRLYELKSKINPGLPKINKYESDKQRSLARGGYVVRNEFNRK